MDSVLCDFTKMFREITGMSMEDYAEKYNWKDAWKVIEEQGVEFWSELDWMPDGKELWNYIKDIEGTEILSALPFGVVGIYAKEGKDIWCHENLDNYVKVNTVIGGANKYKFIKEPTDILIDDMERNCKLWKQNGGIAIHHKDAKTTIKELENIMNKHILEYKSFTTPEEDRINQILDRGLDKASDFDMEILKNQGKFPYTQRYVGIPDKLEFEFDESEDYGDELRVKGTLYYNGEEYYGWFTLPKSEEDRGKNYWDFFKGKPDHFDYKEFDPEPDDLYELDSMIQQIEFEHLELD